MRGILTLCVHPDTLLLGDNQAISSYGPNQNVLSEKGLVKVEQTFERDYDGDLIEVKGTGLLPFEVTPDHPLLVIRRYGRHGHNDKYASFTEPRWMEARNLVEKHKYLDEARSHFGDYLILPKIKPNQGPESLDLTPFISANPRACVIKTIPLDKDISWLIGLYVSEGHSTSSGPVFYINSSEHLIRYKIAEISRGLGLCVSVARVKNESGIHVKISSTIFARALESWCGHLAQNKKIPDFILFHADDRIVKSFLEGYLVGNGTLARIEQANKLFAIARTASKILALQLQVLYARLGHFASIRISRRDKGVIQDRISQFHDIYSVTVYKEELTHHEILERPEYFLVPIRRLTHGRYSGHVNNLRTSSETFLINNIITHNCGSTRFRKEFEEVNRVLELNDWIVLTVASYYHSEKDPSLRKWIERNKKQLDKLHLIKIELSQAIVIIDVKGYIGSSTRAEINHARKLNKPLYYWSDKSWLALTDRFRK